MKCVMIAATSQDGFLTKGNDPDPRHWTSHEDKAHFSKILRQYRFKVQGRNTYETYGRLVPKPGNFMIVLTKNPEDYSAEEITGRLEFKSMPPKQIIDNYKNKFDNLLVLGGSYVFEEFLKANLIDEIWLTVEPVINHSGVTLLKSSKSLEEVVPNLPKPDIRQLNNRGTILKHYILKK